MIETMTDLPAGITGFKASGKVTRQDYERTLEPILDAARREDRHLRFLYQFGRDFDGFTAGGAWEDAKAGLRSSELFDACAIVTDAGWIRGTARVANLLTPCPVRVFEVDAVDDAIEWLHSITHERRAIHRLLGESGVIVVEPTEPLRVRDFDALTETADGWIDAHGELRGLVMHTRDVPGWDGVPSFLRHMRFVRKHHRKVKRVALATDSRVRDLACRVGNRLLETEMRAFDYDQLGDAIAWAKGDPLSVVLHPPTIPRTMHN